MNAINDTLQLSGELFLISVRLLTFAMAVGASVADVLALLDLGSDRVVVSCIMRILENAVQLTASGLTNHLGCRHLAHLNLFVARGVLEPPDYVDPALEPLQQRGYEHKAAYVQHLPDNGLMIARLGEGEDLEFLYSLSGLNVATSRPRCVCILVANPKLFEPECRTPRQMKLANAFSDTGRWPIDSQC